MLLFIKNKIVDRRKIIGQMPVKFLKLVLRVAVVPRLLNLHRRWLKPALRPKLLEILLVNPPENPRVQLHIRNVVVGVHIAVPTKRPKGGLALHIGLNLRQVSIKNTPSFFNMRFPIKWSEKVVQCAHKVFSGSIRTSYAVNPPMHSAELPASPRDKAHPMETASEISTRPRDFPQSVPQAR